MELHIYLKRIDFSLCWCVYGSLSYNTDFGLCALLIALDARRVLSLSCRPVGIFFTASERVQAGDAEKSAQCTEWECELRPSWGF